MIAHNSKSYPYLAIAQHYNVPYAEVLKYADGIKPISKKMDTVFVPTKWCQEVWNLELAKNAGKWS